MVCKYCNRSHPVLQQREPNEYFCENLKQWVAYPPPAQAPTEDD